MSESNSGKPTFHAKYKVSIEWEKNQVDFYAVVGGGNQSIKIFSLEELKDNGKVVASDGDIVIVVKYTKKGDRLSFGILDKSVPEEQQSWKNYLTAKLIQDKTNYALFTFD